MGRVGVLVGDRNAEIRRAACQALHLVYTRMDGPTLLTHIAHATPPEQVSLNPVPLPRFLPSSPHTPQSHLPPVHQGGRHQPQYGALVAVSLLRFRVGVHD